MNRSDPVYIFHLARSGSADGAGIFLHPFRDRGQILRILERSDVRGLYGTDPDVTQVYELRARLYSLLDGAVRQWVGDARFVPRFLLSALIFLIVYFGMTLAIMRSVPVVTALVASVIVGILSYLFMSGRDVRSEAVLKRRIALRSRVDAIRFEESEFVHQIENRLALLESMEFGELVEILGTDDDDFMDEFPDECSQLYRYLRRMFGRFEVFDALFLRLAPVRTAGRIDPTLPFAPPSPSAERIETLRRKVVSGKIDLPLYALYMQLRANVISNR